MVVDACFRQTRLCLDIFLCPGTGLDRIHYRMAALGNAGCTRTLTSGLQSGFVINILRILLGGNDERTAICIWPIDVFRQAFWKDWNLAMD